ncbi:MAG: Flp family type IVb pilin [Terriglobia bacterium]
MVKRILWRLWKENSGQDLVEYALLVVLLALAAVATLGTLANTVQNTFSNAASTLTTTT